MTQKYQVKVSMKQAAIVETGIVLKQGDFGMQIEIEVLDFDATGTTPQIVFRKVMGAVESTTITVSSNKYTYTFKGTELDTPGKVFCDLKLKNSTTQRISTASFMFKVVADTLDGLAEESSSYSDTIEQLLANTIQKSETAGLMKNDGTVDTKTYALQSDVTEIGTNIDTLDRAIEFVDFGNEYGYVVGKLNSSGVVDTSETSTRTSGDYIPVAQGDKIVLQRPSTNAFTFTYCIYGSSKQLKSYQSVSIKAPATIEITQEDAAYIRYSMSEGALNNGLLVRKESIVDKAYAIASSNAEQSEDLINILYAQNIVKDYAFEYGFEIGYLNPNDGTVDSTNLNYYTIKQAFPVSARFNIDLIGSADAETQWTLVRVFYDESMQYIEGTSMGVTGTSKAYATPDSTKKFCKYCINKAAYESNTISIYSVLPIESLTTLNKALLFKEYGDTYGYTTGRLNSSGAVDTSETIFKTIVDYIPVAQGDKIVFQRPSANAFTVTYCVYNSSKQLISYQNESIKAPVFIELTDSGAAFLKYSISEGALNNGLLVRKESMVDESWFNSKEALRRTDTDGYVKYPYTGEEVNLVPQNECFIRGPLFTECSTEPSGKTGQGMCIYKNILFQFFGEDLVRLYDMDRKKLIGDISGDFGHGNNAGVSNEFYSISDEFPLIYVAKVDGSGLINVCRITRSASTTIRSLYFDPSLYGYSPQASLDNLNNVLYVQGKVANETYVTEGYIISKFDPTDLTDNGDGTYTPALIDSFVVEPPSTGTQLVAQGFQYLNGSLFMSSGGTSHEVFTRILVLDLTSKTFKTVFKDFPETALLDEAEGLDFITNYMTGKYEILMHVRGAGYYQIVNG